jgi:hypothetical protein
MIHLTGEELARYRAQQQCLLSPIPRDLTGRKGYAQSVRAFAKRSGQVPVVNAEQILLGFILPTQATRPCFLPICYEHGQAEYVEAGMGFDAVELREEASDV